jgi:hypothetical protein
MRFGQNTEFLNAKAGWYINEVLGLSKVKTAVVYSYSITEI